MPVIGMGHTNISGPLFPALPTAGFASVALRIRVGRPTSVSRSTSALAIYLIEKTAIMLARLTVVAGRAHRSERELAEMSDSVPGAKASQCGPP